MTLEKQIRVIVKTMTRQKKSFEAGSIVTSKQRITFQISVKDLKK